MRSLFTSLVLLVALAGAARAGPFEDGLAAYRDGDYQTALEHWQKAAAQDHTGAMLNLGVIHDRGQGVPENDEEAVKWYRAAANAGIAEAQYYLGQKVWTGEGVDSDPAEAAQWYRRAAEQGHVRAQRTLGVLYLNGEGVARDPGEAFKWIDMAARQGDVESFHNLAFMYQNGLGTGKDRAEAINWYRKAAEQGLAKSQYTLGTMHMGGEDGPADFAAAERWFRMAAEQGNAEAQTGLGALYANGQGVERDDVLAHMWFQLAANQGYEPAVRYREMIADRLDAAQLSESGQKATEQAGQHAAAGQGMEGSAPPANGFNTASAGNDNAAGPTAIFYSDANNKSGDGASRGRVAWQRVEKKDSPPSILARVEMDDPAFSLDLTVSKNTDEYLPATHLVEITIKGARAISDVPVERIPALVLKSERNGQGTPLAGAGARVTDTIFWLALSEVPETAWRNLALLRSGKWFEMPIEFKDKRRSLLVFEKGPAGKRIVEKVIAEWGGSESAKSAAPQ